MAQWVVGGDCCMRVWCFADHVEWSARTRTDGACIGDSSVTTGNSSDQKKKEALPPPPTEKWDYVNSLPNREVEVEAKDLPVSDIPYIMQCGAYKTLQQAEERKAKIAFQGLASKVRKKEDSSWYRVVLGPYKFKRDAEKDKHKLQRAKIEPCAIWKESQ